MHTGSATMKDASAAPRKRGARPRILVAHAVSRARTGGMSRIMGEIHDRIARDGTDVDYFCRDDFAWGGHGLLGRHGFPPALFAHAAAAARAGRPYDLINVHEPSAATLVAWRARIGNPAIVLTSHGVGRRNWDLGVECGD